MKRVSLAAFATVLTATSAMAFDCPFGADLNDQQRDTLCAELNDILVSRATDSQGTRDSDGLDGELARILDASPEFHEAFRADPKRTLDLIARIRNAGGVLPQ